MFFCAALQPRLEIKQSKTLLSIIIFSKEGWDEGRDSGVIDDALRSLVETIRQRAGLLSIAPLVPGGPLEGLQPDLR